jgi:hypothetical protein
MIMMDEMSVLFGMVSPWAAQIDGVISIARRCARGIGKLAEKAAFEGGKTVRAH